MDSLKDFTYGNKYDHRGFELTYKAGTITSNYLVRYVHISLYDGENNLVSREIQQNNYDVFKVGLKKYSVKLLTVSAQVHIH